MEGSHLFVIAADAARTQSQVCVGVLPSDSLSYSRFPLFAFEYNVFVKGVCWFESFLNVINLLTTFI